MRRIGIVWLCAMIALSSLVVGMSANEVEGRDVQITPCFAGGNGTLGNPYQIADVNDLQDMINDLDAHYVLGNDVDASATAAWNGDAGFVPVGNNTAYFNGTFDGNGHVIFNLTINRSTTDYVGLFGYLNESASIDDLGLENVNMTGHDCVGGLAGRNWGTITNCYSTGNASGTGAIGGFVGWNEVGTITNCYSTGNATGDDYVGGFTGGWGAGTITNCYSTGNASGNNLVGGFSGDNIATIMNCYSTGNASGAAWVGGFAGANGGTITYCFWDMDTSGWATSAGGTGKTTIEMKLRSTFNPPWDFINTWGIIDGSTYPFLTTISPIITTWKVHLVNNPIDEDTLYSFDFDSTAQVLPDYNMINWTVSANVESWLSIDSDGLVTGIPNNADVGTHSVSIMATDSLGSTGNFNYNLTVRNTAPVITTIDIDSVVSGSLYFNDYDSTDDGQGVITWSMVTNATWLDPIYPTGTIAGIPSNSDAGTYWVNVSVDDGNGGMDCSNFSLEVKIDTDHDGIPDDTDTDDDNDGHLDTADDFPLDPTEWLDTDADGTGNNADTDDDADGWADIVEILAGTDPLDNSSVPSDADSDGIADFMDPDFLTTTVWNNETIWNNQTIPEYHNTTVWNNETVPEYHNTTLWNNETVPEYHNSTVWNNETVTQTITETPAWAWVAVIVAVALGALAAAVAAGRKSGGKGKRPEKVPEPELQPEEGTPAEE